MPYIPDQQINTGNYVPSTTILDVSQLYEVDVTSPQFKELLVRLYQTVNTLALSLNLKESSYRLQEEFVSGQQWFNPTSADPLQLRPSFIKVINIGALPAGVTNVAHGIAITNTFVFTAVYGAASDQVGLNFYPLPYPSPGGATNISVQVNAANVVITNNSGIAFTQAVITLEYIKY